MKPSPTILLATAFDAESDAATAEARSLAQKLGARVHVVHVLAPFVGPSPTEPYSTGAYGPVLGEPLALAKRRMEEVCQAVFPGAADEVVGHLRIGRPAHEIVEVARDVEVDMIVLGTHGRTGAARVLLGSVAEAVVRTAPCAVLVARAKEEVDAPAIEPPCPACVDARRAAGDPTVWCERHQRRHVTARTHYERPTTFGVGSQTFRPGDGWR